MKKILIAVVIVPVIGEALYAWHRGYSASESKPHGTVAITITLTDDGYVPSELTIKKGEAVRWVNDSNYEMWPASAVHPTHSLYPGKSPTDCLGSSFDACARIPGGGSWEFTFNDVGSWKFHDHVRPSKTGVVDVR